MKAIYALILTVVLSVSVVFSQNAKIDSLKKVIETTKVDTVKGRSLCRLCSEFRKISEYESGLKKGEEGLTLSERIKDVRGEALCLNNIGNIYFSMSNFPNSLNYYEKSLPKFKQADDKRGEALCLNNMGNIYLDMVNYSKALDCYQKSLLEFQRINNKSGEAHSLRNIGIVYENTHEYKKAIDYFQRSLSIRNQVQDYQGVADCYFSIANIYESLKKYNESLDFYLKSMEIFERLNDTIGLASGMNCMGVVFLNQKDYRKSLEAHQKALALNHGNKDPMINITAILNIAHVYLKLNKLALCRTNVEKGLKSSKEINHLPSIKVAYSISYKADSALGNWKSAFEHHKLYKQYSDSLHNEDKAKEFGRVESKYEFEKEAEEAKRKEAERNKKETEIMERRNNLQYLTIFAGIIGLFAGLVFIGKFRIPTRVMDVAVFAGLLITFEFLLILFDPLFEQYSGGIPFYKLGFNTVVAFGFAPLHGFLEGKLKKRFVKSEL